jgi:hypothetical protein
VRQQGQTQPTSSVSMPTASGWAADVQKVESPRPAAVMRTRVGKHAQPGPRPRDQQAAALRLRQRMRPPLLVAQLQGSCPYRLPRLHGDQAGTEGPPVLQQLQQEATRGVHTIKRLETRGPARQHEGAFKALLGDGGWAQVSAAAAPTTGGVLMSGWNTMSCSGS